MKKLYIVRHAESEANKLDILAGRLDYALSDEGRRQAAAISRAFAAEHSVQLVVTSPLKRARETADYFIEALGNPPRIVRPELTEVHMGHYSGMTYTELDSAEGYQHDRAARWDWEPEGSGETYAKVADRVRLIFGWLDTRPETDILIVSHGVAMRLLQGHLENTLPAYPVPLAKNGEVWKIHYKGLGTVHAIERLFYLDNVTARRA